MKWRNGLFDFIRKLYRDRGGEWERERETAVRVKMDFILGVGGGVGDRLCDTSKCDFRSDSVLCVFSPLLSVYPLKYN